MTPTKIKTTIAEIMGWKVIYRTNLLVDSMAVLLNPKGEVISQDEDPDSTIENFDYLLPNYPTSLDACAEFEKDASYDYFIILWKGVVGEIQPMNEINMMKLMKATTLQRCEAFLRLHGKGEEGD